MSNSNWPDDAQSDWAREDGPNAWDEIYGHRRMRSAELLGERRRLRGLAWTLSALIPLTALNEASYALDYFTREPSVLGPGEFAVGFNYGFYYPLAAIHGLSFLMVTVTAGIFITWQYKHARNARALGQVHGLGPGWAIGGWFIPFANVILPVIQLVQSSKASDPVPKHFSDVESRTSLVVLWAVVFYVSLLEVSVQSEESSTAATADTLSGFLALLILPAAALALAMIWQLTKRQEVALDAQGIE
jgi:hypothetical protein